MTEKPLKNWTFDEARAECAENGGCDGCFFYADGKCEIKRILTEGSMKDISSPFRWTFPATLTEPEQEI